MNRSILRSPCAIALVVALSWNGTAIARDPSAASAAASEASIGSVVGAGSVLVDGTLVAMSLAGTAVVASVEVAGESTTVVLRGVSDATTVTVRLAGNASLAMGSIIEVVAVSTGCVLITAGRIVGFVPNEVGRALVHQRSIATLR